MWMHGENASIRAKKHDRSLSLSPFSLSCAPSHPPLSFMPLLHFILYPLSLSPSLSRFHARCFLCRVVAPPPKKRRAPPKRDTPPHTHIHTQTHTDTQTHRDTQRHRQTNRQSNRQTDRHTPIHTCYHVCCCTSCYKDYTAYYNDYCKEAQTIIFPSSCAKRSYSHCYHVCCCTSCCNCCTA